MEPTAPVRVMDHVHLPGGPSQPSLQKKTQEDAPCVKPASGLPLARCCIKMLVVFTMVTACAAARLETKDQMLAFLRAHPSRAYFSRLMRDGPYAVGMQVGVADGRFSEHFLLDAQPKAWYMVEPFPNKMLQARYPPSTSGRRAPRLQLKEMPTSWASRGIGTTSRLRFFKAFSLDKAVLDAIAPGSVDFIYLDGVNASVAWELEPYYRMLRPGGMLAGQDYCKYDERPLSCRGCADVPACVKYTEYGVRHGKGDRRAANQWGVARAVQEWLARHPELEVYHTTENFTRTSLAQDGMDYDLVITNTSNPSWYVFKKKSSVIAPMAKSARCDSTSPTAGAQELVYLQRRLRLEARVERADTSVRRLSYFRTILGISGGKYHTTGNRCRNSRAPTIDSSSPTSWTSRGR